MYIKWMVPDYGMRGILNGIGRFLFGENDEVHYIGGAEVLPPPLDAGEESVCIRMLATDAAEEARRKQSASGGIYRKKVRQYRSRRGGFDLDRHHRSHQSDQHIQSG